MKLLLTFLCLIVQLAYSQGNQKKTPEQSITESDINKEIRKAQELSSKDIKQTLQLSKDAYQQSKKLGYTKGIVESSNIMITKYYDMGRYKDVIELGKESEKYAVDISNYEVLSNIYLLIGLSYTDLGFNDQSLKSFKKALKVAEKINSKNHQFYKKSLIYNGLASHSAHINAPIDSVVYYQKMTLETILKVNDDQEYLDRKNSTLALAYINLGKTSNALHQTKDSEVYFSKALEILQDKNYIGNKFLEVSVYNEFAWLYYDQKKYPQSIMYAGKGEELEKQINSPYLRRDIYEVMFKSYVDVGQKERSSEYMNLFTKLNDSIENAENISINTPIKVITDEQTQVHTSDIHKTWIIVLGGILILAILTWFLWRKNQNHLHKKYRNIIESLETEKNDRNLSDENTSTQKNSSDHKIITITDHTAHILLEKLNKFEQSKKFLKKDVSRVYLANLLNTNTKYLTEIIRQHTGKNFNNYINGLRIQYITEKLYHDPKYREYKISYLAEESGFSSREIFAVTFKKETGVSPSYFIAKLQGGDHEAES